MSALRVAVIGGGFCGAFFAAQLAEYSTVPLVINVIEPRERLGSGVAYSTTDPAHRLNVPASRMILFPEAPDHFDLWFRHSGELDKDREALWHDGKIYPRRAAFGRYVAEVVALRQATRRHAPITHIRDRVIGVSRLGPTYRLTLQTGAALDADIVVLATSHPPPAVPALLVTSLKDDPRLISNPWTPGALEGITPDSRLAIIGTGLTMADVVASLARRGHRGPITAFSRRGQLSRGHAAIPAPFAGLDLHALPHATRGLLHAARELVRMAAADGYPWQAVFDALRANGQTIWQTLNDNERRRFLRHLRVYWDVHRYRIAPQVEDVLRRKQENKTLTVYAASLRATTPRLADILLTLQPRRSGGTIELAAEHIVVTTGPDHGTVIAHNPALTSLAAQGLIRPDPLGLGIDIDAASQAIGHDGTSGPTLLIAGPLGRGHFGELMGLPQVAAQPDKLAAQLATWAENVFVKEPSVALSPP